VIEKFPFCHAPWNIVVSEAGHFFIMQNYSLQGWTFASLGPPSHDCNNLHIPNVQGGQYLPQMSNAAKRLRAPTAKAESLLGLILDVDSVRIQGTRHS
jgi:hypothetical protein